MTRKRRWMTTLEMYAQHGSVSYGDLDPERLREILLGDPPTSAELVRAEQAVMETPVSSAHQLAAELGISFADLDARAVELFGQPLAMARF